MCMTLCDLHHSTVYGTAVQSGTTHVFPAERCFAALAVDVGDGVETGQQHSLFRLTASHVYTANHQHQQHHHHRNPYYRHWLTELE